MNLQELKIKKPEDLLKQAVSLGIENPSSLRKQDLMFAILKKIALEGETTVETKSGFGYTVTVEDLLKFVGLDDDIIRK